MQDGLIHSILNNDSPVNRKFVDQTETRQFKRWFGDSKVVDEEGKPLVVYHATDADFTVFDRDKLGKRTKERDIEDFNRNMEDSVGLLRSAELGFWFSEKNLAEDEYGGRDVLKLEDGKRIGMPVYLSIENPNYVDTYDLMETLDNMTVEEYLQEMEDYGYDGLIVTDQEFDMRRATLSLSRTRSRARRIMWGRSQISAILFLCAAMASKQRSSIPSTTV